MKNCAVIYCRVSTEDQVDNSSLSTQQKECRAKAQELGCKVLREFRDEGASGATQDRPALQEMIKFCQEHSRELKYVIVKNVDRFARDTLVHLTLRQIFRAAGIEVIFVNQPSTSEGTPAARLTENIFSSFATFERENILDRTRRGTRETILNGGWTAQAPYGYVNSRTADGVPTLAPQKEQAKIVLRIHESFAGGMTLMEVANDLNTLGVKSPRGGKWSAQSVDNILRNPVYIGKIVNKNYPDKVIEGLHVGIVPLELWMRVQKRFSGKLPSKKLRFNPRFPLAILLRCPVCGAPMTGSDSTGKLGKKYPYYHCRKAGCKSKSYSKEHIEKEFLEALRFVRPTPEGVQVLERELKSVWYEKWRQHTEDRKTLRTRLTNLEQKRDQIEDSFITKRIADDTYQRQLAKANGEIAQVQEKLNQLMINEDRIKELMRFMRRFLDSISNTWLNAIPEHKRLVQRFVFPAGLTLEKDGTFRTLTLPPLLELARGSVPENSTVAAPTFRITSPLLETMVDWYKVLKDIAPLVTSA